MLLHGRNFQINWESVQTSLPTPVTQLSLESFKLNTRGYWRRNVELQTCEENEPSFFKIITHRFFALEGEWAFQRWGTTRLCFGNGKESIGKLNLASGSEHFSIFFGAR